MTESEVFAKFAEFGYYVLKAGNKYSVFDRRTARRINEYESLESLLSLANDVFFFDFMTEILEKTVTEFRKIYGLIDEVNTRDSEQGEMVPPADPEPEQGPEAEKETATEPEQAKDAPVFDLVCKGCGKHFQSTRRKSYCSEACYPSNQEKKLSDKAITMRRPF